MKQHKFKIKGNFKGNLEVDGEIILTDYNEPEPEPVPDWPNMPAGFKVLNQWDLSGVPAATSSGSSYVDEPIPNSNGWRSIYNRTPGTMYPNDPAYGDYANTPFGYTECIDADDAPCSPKKVYRLTYPEGMREGNGAGTMYLAWGQTDAIREFYAGYWWKPSADFGLSNNGTKMHFMFNGNNGQIFIILDNNRHVCVMPEYPTDPPNQYYIRQPNVDTTPVQLGTWHLIEWYVNLDTHVIQWWVDKVLTGNYHDLVENKSNFDMYQISSTYGGCCSHTRPNTCEYYYDHLIIAVPDLSGPVTLSAKEKTPKFRKLPKEFKLPPSKPWSDYERK